MIITALQEVGGEACLREVAKRVAEMEAGGEWPPNRSLSKSVYVSMVQNHLPKMRLAGIVEYDVGADTLRLIDLPPDYRCLLEFVERGDVPWCLYYLALSVAGILSGLLYAAYGGASVGSNLILIFSSLVLASSLLHTARTYGLRGNELLLKGNESLTRVKHTLTKYLNPPSYFTPKGEKGGKEKK
jgi:hypothetical protein